MRAEDHPAAAGTAGGPGQRRRGASLAVRLLVAFLALAAVFGGTVGWGLYRSSRALDQVRLLDEGYLRLALSTAELRATQSILLTLLERILDEKDSAVTRSWVEAVRRLRPERLERLGDIVARIRTLAEAPEDRATLDRLGGEITALGDDARAGDEALGRFFAALDGGRPDEARTTLDALLERERSVDRTLRGVGRVADRQVSDLSSTLQRDETRTF